MYLVDRVGTVRQGAALRRIARLLRSRTRSARRVFYDDLGAALVTDGLDGLVDQVDELLKELQPGLVVIDSFKAHRCVRGRRSRVPAVPPRPRRPPHRGRRERVLDRRVRPRRSDRGCRSSPSPTRSSRWTPNAPRSARPRVLQVLKLRGSGFQIGRARLPHQADRASTSSRGSPTSKTPRATHFGTDRDSTGIAALDDSARRRLLGRLVDPHRRTRPASARR